MTQGFEPTSQCRRRLGVDKEAHLSAPEDRVVVLTRGELQDGGDVVGLQIRIVQRHLVVGRARRHRAAARQGSRLPRSACQAGRARQPPASSTLFECPNRSFTTWTGVPACQPRRSSTSLTRTRRPRMQGRPPHTAGSTVIRSIALISPPLTPLLTTPILARGQIRERGRRVRICVNRVVTGVPQRRSSRPCWPASRTPRAQYPHFRTRVDLV